MLKKKSATLELTQQLMRLPSITPQDAGCQKILAERLHALGFVCEQLRFGEVDNLWARFGTEQPVLVFAGHTDVVPPGPLAQWLYPPFVPTVANGFLYGRGAADMKSNIAAMVVACEQFLQQFAVIKGSIAFLITSDEEGPGILGTRKMMEMLSARGESLTWCIVGEPSSEKQLGDTLKVGRRGSLNAQLTIKGKQGHIAYPQLADNPIHRSFAALDALAKEQWDSGDEWFSATSLQFSNIHAGSGVSNVIPQDLEALFNFRYSPQVTAQQLQDRVVEILDRQHLDYTLNWTVSGLPFFTKKGELLIAAQKAVTTVTGLKPLLSTSGGTSDGRFIAPTGCEVVELGVCNDTIHQINEKVRVVELEQLTAIYQQVLWELFAS